MHDRLTSVLQHKGALVHSVAPTDTVREAVSRMNQAAIGALLVVHDGNVVGIFTERDVLRRVLEHLLDPAKTPVSEVMTRPVISVRPTTSVEEAMSVMTEKRCRHLPVMEGGRAVGMVSIGDLTRWVVRDQSHEIQGLIEYVQGKYPG